MAKLTKKDNHEEMCQEIIEYLETKGWKPFAIGGIRIKQGSLKYNFTFEIDFTGKKLV